VQKDQILNLSGVDLGGGPLPQALEVELNPDALAALLVDVGHRAAKRQHTFIKGHTESEKPVTGRH